MRRVGEAHAINRHLKTVSTLRLSYAARRELAVLNFDPSGLVAKFVLLDGRTKVRNTYATLSTHLKLPICLANGCSPTNRSLA